MPNPQWLDAKVSYPDGVEGTPLFGNETQFVLFDEGRFELTQELSTITFKVKRYKHGCYVSIGGLRTPNGAAGTSGAEAIAESPEHLQEMVTAMCRGDWEFVFPDPMTQENQSQSLNRHGLINREWSAPTVTVSAALERMKVSRKLIPWHLFKEKESQWLKEYRPGIQVESKQEPLLGHMTLVGKLSDGRWIVERDFWVLGAEKSCEKRMIVAPEQLGARIKFVGGRKHLQTQTELDSAVTLLEYARKTKSDPRHIDFDGETSLDPSSLVQLSQRAPGWYEDIRCNVLRYRVLKEEGTEAIAIEEHWIDESDDPVSEDRRLRFYAKGGKVLINNAEKVKAILSAI